MLKDIDAGVQEARQAKMVAFEQQVAQPLASIMRHVDPEAIVMVSGSYAENPSKLRAGSDYDLIVISKLFEEPDQYMAFLQGLGEYANRFRQANGIVPVWFTQIAREEALRYIAYQHCKAELPTNGLSAEENMLPVHLLTYPSVEALQQREPHLLAVDLVGKSKVLTGEKPVLQEPQNSPTFVGNSLMMARWNVERALAELVLNWNNVPYEYIAAQYKGILWPTIRGNIGDALFGQGQSTNPTHILSRIHPELVEHMEALNDIHLNGATTQYPLEHLIYPGILLIQHIDALTEMHAPEMTRRYAPPNATNHLLA